MAIDGAEYDRATRHIRELVLVLAMTVGTLVVAFVLAAIILRWSL